MERLQAYTAWLQAYRELEWNMVEEWRVGTWRWREVWHMAAVWHMAEVIMMVLEYCKAYKEWLQAYYMAYQTRRQDWHMVEERHFPMPCVPAGWKCQVEVRRWREVWRMVEEWQEVKAMGWFMVEDLWEDIVDMAVDLTKVDGAVKARGMEKAEKGTSHLKV